MLGRFAQSVDQHDVSQAMPKGSTVNRKLRQELQELKARLDNVDTRPPLTKPIVYDWVCNCQYYCYYNKQRCPRCGCSKGQGQPRPGFQRRVRVDCSNQAVATGIAAARNPGPQFSPTHRVQQAGSQRPIAAAQQVVSRKTYSEAVKTSTGELTQARSQAQHMQQTLNPPQQPCQGRLPQQQPLQLQQPQHNMSQTVVQYAPVLPIGSQSPAMAASPPTQAPHNTSTTQPPLIANIFTADEEAQLEQEDGGTDETIQELDSEVRDPHKIWSRMGKLSRAVEKRKKRLERARDAVQQQAAILEEAKVELNARTQAADEIEADIHRLEEVQIDLSKKHAQLVAEITQQQRGPPPPVEGEAERAQRLLWDVASNLRNLGDNPKLSQAIALLGDLYQQASQVAAGGAIDQPATSPSAGAEVVAATAPSVAGPTQTPVSISTQIPTPCGQCWSFACRCGPAHPPHPAAAPSVPASVDIEVDLERGKKRSCSEASLPGRASGCQQTQGAILVDSCGNPAAPAEADTEAVVEAELNDEGVAAGLQHESLQGDGATRCQAAVDEGPGSLDAESGAAKSGLHDRTDNGGTSNEEEKEKSRKSFAALVRETCSTRACPY